MFPSLKAAVQKVCIHYASDMWTNRQLSAFLSVSSLNAEAIDCILKAADSNTQWPDPATWSQAVHIQQLVDVIMHLLGLGIGKAANHDLIHSWLTKRKLLALFLHNTSVHLVSIQ